MSRVHTCRIQARSYELDGFGHVNYAVYLSYFEYARYQALKDGGFTPEDLARRGEAVHVVHVEVDYLAELRLGEDVILETTLADTRRTSMTFRQVAHRPGDPSHVYARAEVVAVWIGANGRPTRVPDEVRRALGTA